MNTEMLFLFFAIVGMFAISIGLHEMGHVLSDIALNHQSEYGDMCFIGISKEAKTVGWVEYNEKLDNRPYWQIEALATIPTALFLLLLFIEINRDEE